jgi:hypothetical protein
MMLDEQKQVTKHYKQLCLKTAFAYILYVHTVILEGDILAN